MIKVKFSIEAFIESLPPESRPPAPVGRFNQKYIAEKGLVEQFKIWKTKQYRLLKQLSVRTEETKERDRIDQVVSRARRQDPSLSREEAMLKVMPRRQDASGPISKAPRWYEVEPDHDIRTRLFDKLEKTKFKTTDRTKAIAQGQSLIIGTVYSKRLKKYTTSYTTKFNPVLYSLVKQLASKEVPDFHYTTVAINKNVVTNPHTDKYNVGPTLILALGDFEGGDLVVRAKEHDLSSHKWLYFWGKEEHYNRHLESGTKYTITLFTLLPPYVTNPNEDTHRFLGNN